VLKLYVTDMDRVSRYSEEVNKVSDINQVHKSGLVVQEEECTIDFTTNDVK